MFQTSFQSLQIVVKFQSSYWISKAGLWTSVVVYELKEANWMLSLLLINCFVNVIMNFRTKFTNFGRNFWTLWQFCEINCNVSKGVLLWDISVTLDETTDSEILCASLLSLLILALIMPYVLVLKILWHCIDLFKNTFQKIFVSKNIDGTTTGFPKEVVTWPQFTLSVV